MIDVSEENYRTFLYKVGIVFEGSSSIVHYHCNHYAQSVPYYLEKLAIIV